MRQAGRYLPQYRAVREKVTPESENYCLDVRNGSVAAILEDGQLEVLARV